MIRQIPYTQLDFTAARRAVAVLSLAGLLGGPATAGLGADPSPGGENLALGNLAHVLFITCYHAYFSQHSDNPEHRRYYEMVVKERNQQVRAALRWL